MSNNNAKTGTLNKQQDQSREINVSNNNDTSSHLDSFAIPQQDKLKPEKRTMGKKILNFFRNSKTQKSIRAFLVLALGVGAGVLGYTYVPELADDLSGADDLPTIEQLEKELQKAKQEAVQANTKVETLEQQLLGLRAKTVLEYEDVAEILKKIYDLDIPSTPQQEAELIALKAKLHTEYKEYYQALEKKMSTENVLDGAKKVALTKNNQLALSTKALLDAKAYEENNKNFIKIDTKIKYGSSHDTSNITLTRDDVASAGGAAIGAVAGLALGAGLHVAIPYVKDGKENNPSKQDASNDNHAKDIPKPLQNTKEQELVTNKISDIHTGINTIPQKSNKEQTMNKIVQQEHLPNKQKHAEQSPRVKDKGGEIPSHVNNSKTVANTTNSKESTVKHTEKVLQDTAKQNDNNRGGGRK